MAYNAANELKEELGRVQKNNRGDFLVTTKVTNKLSGAVSVDIRQFYTNDADEVVPTFRGVRFNAENLVDVIEALSKVLEANELMDLSDKFAEMADEPEDESDVPES